MAAIIVTGTPGTGKTALAKKLSRKLNYVYLDVNKIISKYKLSEGYDKARKTGIVDVNKLNKFLIKHIKQFKINQYKKSEKHNGIIIDSHLSHYLPRKYVNFCIVTKCDIKELNARLKNKKFHKEKIDENLQAEIFDICHIKAMEKKHKVFVVNTTKGFNISQLVKKFGV
ncbi:MAG: adenylate kinase family protein [Nanoarchaeota archaeon]